MKMKLLFSVLIVISIFSCKRNNYEEMLPPPLPPDPRDAITGTYIGPWSYHFHLVSQNFDTTWYGIDTMIVKKDASNPDLVILSGVSDSIQRYTPGDSVLQRTTHNYNYEQCSISINDPKFLRYRAGWSAPHASGDYTFVLRKQ